MTPLEQRAETVILELVTERGAGKSICPSEAARLLDPAWQSQLTLVRRAAVRLAVAGRIDILRKGQAADPLTVKGVIRLRLRAPEDEA
jgi:hypothetical protein